jgi:flagellar assembly protein FliH
MKIYRPHRFPPLAQIAAAGPLRAGEDGAWQASVTEGFQQGMDRGYAQGRELGETEGRRAGHEAGRAEGLRIGRDEARRELQASFESVARPVDDMLGRLEQLHADIEDAQRKGVVDLVARVARQVIRAELALQPAQILALVDETLATLPPAPGGVEVFMNPEELQRIRELDPERAQRWALVADPRLDPGECRVKAGDREADAGCRQRLAACMEQVNAQLVGDAEGTAVEAATGSAQEDRDDAEVTA